jgi:hypothetical protein
VLIIKGVEPPTTKHEIVALASKHLEINSAPFDKIFDIRENVVKVKYDEKSANELFGEYLDQIEKVIEAVDNIERT